MRPSAYPRPRLLLLLISTIALLIGPLSACGTSSPGPAGAQSGSLPSRALAFRQSEALINQILLAVGVPPTTEFIYGEGPCNETDDEHGDVVIDYSIPGKYSASQADEELRAVEAAMKNLGLGDPMYQAQDESVSVQAGTFSILFGDNNAGSLGFSVQTCYSTPAPTMSPGSAGAMQPLTVSPAPTSTATHP